MIRRLLFASLVFLSAAALEMPAVAAPKATPAPKAAAAKPAPKAKRPAPAEPFAVPADSGGVPQVSAAAVIVLDAGSGKVLYELNADQQRPVASTQKLLTSLIVSEENMDAMVKVEAADTWCEPSMLYIKPGQVYRRGDLLRVLLVKSMNDVARCLARDNAGSIEAFALKMNAKAAQLGMTHSHFANPNGLPTPGQFSSARDMSKVAMAAYRNRTIRSIVSQKEITWRYPDGHTTVFTNTNRVLRNYALCNGMKTGYTEAAGHCLVSSASANGHDVICVVLGDSQQVWNDSYRLLNWGLGSNGVASNN